MMLGHLAACCFLAGFGPFLQADNAIAVLTANNGYTKTFSSAKLSHRDNYNFIIYHHKLSIKTLPVFQGGQMGLGLKQFDK